MTGWIKLHRDTINWKYFKSSETYQLWTYLLLNAHHSEKTIFDGFGNEIRQGQFSTGRNRIAKDLGLDASKVERILKKLEIEHQIEQQKTNKCRIISITNWAKYQHTEQVIEQQVNINRTSSEQQVNINRTHNKNGDNVDNENNVDNVKNKGAQKSKKPKGSILEFSEDTEIKDYLKNVTHETQNKWLEVYPDKIWLTGEIKKAILWEMNAATKKKNKGQFLSGWFGRGWKNKDTKSGFITKSQQVQQSQDDMMALRNQFINMP